MKKILLVSLIAVGSSLVTYCNAQQPDISFDSLSTGMTSPGAYVLSLAMKDSTMWSPLYAGGRFTIAGRHAAVNIAEWIDTVQNGIANIGKWVALGTGVDSDVCAVAMYNNYLYAGGKFDTAGGIAASHIARWDTATHKWDSLIGTLNGNVYALCVYNHDLFVGGDFTIADGDTVNRIAVWKDSVWLPVGKGFDTGAVYALAVSNDTLYAGGSFLKSNGRVLNHIAKLSGANWAPVGTGTDNTVYALKDCYDNLFVGGAFSKAGGITSRYLSSYEDYSGWKWNSMDRFVNDTVRALGIGYFAVPSMEQSKPASRFVGISFLMIGGNFDSAQGAPNKYFTEFGFLEDSIARFTGSGPVYAVASSGLYSNYVGGIFSAATNYSPYFTQTLNNVAILGFLNLPGGVQNITDKSDVIVYPNPNNGQFIIAISHPELVSGSQMIEVYNMFGEKVYNAFLPQTPKGALNTINLSSQPNGLYLYRIVSDNGNLIGQGKLVIQK